MESPATWNLLTASLAVSDLHEPHNVWAFLVVQGLVSDLDGHRDTFVRIVREEARLDPTGPSLPARVAQQLFDAGIAHPAGGHADPWAKCAAERLEMIALWGPPAVGHKSLSQLQNWRLSTPEQ